MEKIIKYISLILIVSVVFLLKVNAVTYDENNTIELPSNLKIGEYNEIKVNLSSSYSASYLIKDVSNNDDFIDAYATYKTDETAGKDGIENVITSIIENDSFETMPSDKKIKPDNISTDTDKTVLLVVKVSYNDPESGALNDVYRYRIYEIAKANSNNEGNTTGGNTKQNNNVSNSNTGISDVLYIVVPVLLIIGAASLTKKRYE